MVIIQMNSQSAQLRICKSGNEFRAYLRSNHNSSEEWILRDSWIRNDLDLNELQFGLMGFSFLIQNNDYAKIFWDDILIENFNSFDDCLNNEKSISSPATNIPSNSPSNTPSNSPSITPTTAPLLSNMTMTPSLETEMPTMNPTDDTVPISAAVTSKLNTLELIFVIYLFII